MQIFGRDGDLKIGTVAVAEIKSWTLTINQGTASTNTMQSGEWDTHNGGRKNWTAELTVNYDPSDTTGQGALGIGSLVEANMFPEGDVAAKEKWTGNARVTAFSITGDGTGDDHFEASMTLTGTGAVTQGTVS